LTLLLNLLVAGTSTPSPTPLPAFVPPPQHLALAATLVVHPSLNTRAQSAERLQASNLALRLLRHTHRLVGPVNADFDAAFAFTYFNTSRRGGDGRSTRRRRSRSRGDEYSPGSGDDPETINSEIANAGSVWARAEDFWQVVGWALNCSVAYPKRWGRWKVWLEFMMEVLEDDWAVREGMSGETEEGSAEPTMERSLIAKYLRLEGGKLGGNRRVVRAIFADGGTKALNEFTEVFRNETKARKKSDGVVKRPEKKVNVEEDEFADYLEDANDEEDDDDDDADEVAKNPAPGSTSSAGKDDPPDTDGSALLGGMDALTLRLRLLALLSNVSDTLRKQFLPISALYDLYNDHIRPLPIATFFLLTSPSATIPTFSPVARSALNQFILRSLIASSAPNPPTDDLDQDLLERYFLPFAANTASVADNAKVSLLLESLLRLVLRYIGVKVTGGLERAVRVGIEAREKKSGQDRRKKGVGKKGDEGDRAWLVGSGERLIALVEVCKE